MGIRNSVCQTTADTTANIKIDGIGAVTLDVQGSGKHVSLNVYQDEIVVYDEIKQKRIASYTKTA